jgi:CheY-like chemotaxis protein
MGKTAKDPHSDRIVIVAEDEAVIRMVTVDVLSDAGFCVLEAAHAAEALSHLQLRANEIHGLFTDVDMPGEMNGLDLAHHVSATWPWVVLLVTSGKPAPATHRLPAGSRFLPKPYDFNHVVQHVREMIDAAGR